MTRLLHFTHVTPADAAVVHRLTQEAYAVYFGRLSPPSGTEGETVEAVKTYLETGGAVLALRDAVPVGVARYRHTPEHYWVERVAVGTAHQNTGVASALLGYLEGFIRAQTPPVICVEVRLSLPKNVAFYRKRGYTVRSHHHYPDGTDSWYRMVKRVGG